MKNFSFTAYDTGGAKINGEVESQSMDEANQILLERQLIVVSLSPSKSPDNGVNRFFTNRMSAKELEYFTSELSLMLNSGVKLDRALAVMRRNASGVAQTQLIVNIHDAIRRGESLSDAMSNHPQVFSSLYVNLVKLGESSGTLSRMFFKLAEDIKFQSELKRKTTQALTYPLVIFFVCILCVLFIFNYIVPQMKGLFDGIPDIPAYTSFLLGASDWMIQYQWFLLLGIIGLCALILALIRSSVWSRSVDEALLRIPWLSGILKLIEQIRFNTAVSMMLESGILIDRCLDMATGSVKNRVLMQGLLAAKDRVKKGDTLARALGSSSLFPDLSVSLIEVGEESGQLATVFSELADRSRREFETLIARFTMLLEPILILFMGAIVGGVVVTMLLSIVSINEIGI